MATGTINTIRAGWTSAEVIDENTYGKLVGLYNGFLGLATISWEGNSSTPPSGSQQYQFTIPAKYKPKRNYTVVLRHGDMMEIRADLHVNVNLTGQNWSGGVVLYPLA